MVRPTPLVAASDLKRQRGWTEGLVERLLGAPDALAPNPHGFRSPMRWYALDRVLEAEADPSFVRWAASLDERRTWRRAQPTRTALPAEIDRLEWLADPRRIALFVVPRVPRRRRPRPAPDASAEASPDRAGGGHAPEPPRYALGRFEVLRLF